MRDSDLLRLLAYFIDTDVVSLRGGVRSIYKPIGSSITQVGAALYKRSKVPRERAFKLLRSAEGNRYVERRHTGNRLEWDWYITQPGRVKYAELLKAWKSPT